MPAKRIRGRWKVVKYEYIFQPTGEKRAEDQIPPFAYPNWQKDAPSLGCCGLPSVCPLMLAAILPVVCASLACGAAFAKPCLAVPEQSALRRKAEAAVLALPELQSWRRTHSYPVAFIPSVDQSSAAPDGSCVLSVTVYAHRPDRFERWNTFFTTLSSPQVRWVSDEVDGELIPLRAWRKRRAAR